MDVIIGQLFAGLSVGSVLLLAALGLALTFGQMGIINMAHGEFLMIGAYTAFVVQKGITDAGFALLIAIPVSFLVAGIFGVLMEELLLRRLYVRPLDTLLVTFGVSLILQQAARDIFGAPAVEVKAPEWLIGSVELFGTSLPMSRLFIIGVSLLVVGLLSALMAYTPFGRRIRAVVLNRDLAEVSGISSRAIDRLTFFIGSGVAGIAGVTLTLIGSTGPTLGNSYVVDAFLIVVAGGVGKLAGSVIAAFVLGILQATVEFQTSPSIGKIVVFVVIIVFLQIRPQGIFSFKTRSLA
jgi:urea transport system permease protein